jgi:hypothetical protein
VHGLSCAETAPSKKGAFSEPPLTRVWRGRRKNQMDWGTTASGVQADPEQARARTARARAMSVRSLWMAGLARVPAGRSNAGAERLFDGGVEGKKGVGVGWPPELNAAVRERSWGVVAGRAGARPGRAGVKRGLARSEMEAVPQPGAGRAFGSLPLLSGGERDRAPRASITCGGERVITEACA